MHKAGGFLDGCHRNVTLEAGRGAPRCTSECMLPSLLHSTLRLVRVFWSAFRPARRPPRGGSDNYLDRWGVRKQVKCGKIQPNERPTPPVRPIRHLASVI